MLLVLKGWEDTNGRNTYITFPVLKEAVGPCFGFLFWFCHLLAEWLGNWLNFSEPQFSGLSNGHYNISTKEILGRLNEGKEGGPTHDRHSVNGIPFPPSKPWNRLHLIWDVFMLPWTGLSDTSLRMCPLCLRLLPPHRIHIPTPNLHLSDPSTDVGWIRRAPTLNDKKKIDTKRPL